MCADGGMMFRCTGIVVTDNPLRHRIFFEFFILQQKIFILS
jgi:hypothetical protein